MGEAYTEYPVGRRGDRARLLCWYSFEISLLRMARVLTSPKPTQDARNGLGVEVRRSPQAVACRKRYVEELGRPPGLLAVGRSAVGYTAIKARKGKPGHRVKREPKRLTGKPCGEAEEYCERESPPDVQGESYQA
jgi:hypothetical protein